MSVPLRARILLADDHQMVRDGLRLIIDSARDLRVEAVAGDGEEALAMALSEEFDLAVLDVAMPRMTGLRVAEELAKQRPELRTLILSMHSNEQYYLEALRAGASGYVLKSSANRDLIEACRAVLRGSTIIYPPATQAIRDRLEASRADDDHDLLSPRERDVVKLIAEGFTSAEIGEILIISSKTVDRHRANALEKLGLRNRVELTRYAIRSGLVEA
jgi:DNA-binding NarL/FixJ family response regulator